MSQRILILDGIPETPLGCELSTVLTEAKHNVFYLDPRTLRKKRFYKIRRMYHKLFKKNPYTAARFTHFPKYSSAAAKKILELHQPNLVLVIGYYYRHLDREILMQLKQALGFNLILLDTESANMALNHYHLQYFFEYEIASYDKVYSFSKRMTRAMQDLGHTHVNYLPYGGVNYQPLLRSEGVVQPHDVVFAGSPCMRRVLLLENLCAYDLLIIGHATRWQPYQPLISTTLFSKLTLRDIWGSELHHILKQAKIILNINNFQWYGIGSGVNLRVIETLSLGQFLLTEYCEELSELFVLGQEIETFKTAEEMVEKVKYYLAHDEERLAIAARGHQAFLERHLWTDRLSILGALIN